MIFLDDLKIAGFNPDFKGGDRFHWYTIDQQKCSHAFPTYLSVLTIQLDNQIFEAFQDNLITPGVFTDYSKSL